MALVICTSLNGKPAHSADQHSIVSFSESVRELSARSGPPGSFRNIEDLRMLPLSHHSLWDRMRDGFQFVHLDHPKIDLQVEFLQNGMRSLHTSLTNARPVLRYIVEQIELAGMPLDIAMLPLVESAFNPHAKSSQNALGLWQFIPDTGRLYGLHENEWYSGRKDIVASTEAALKYLRQLHKTFDDDWLLALAAYNTGQGNVRLAIKRAKKRGVKPDFWNLRLARETRDYVPRLLAVNRMLSSPEQYGIILPPLSDRKIVEPVTLAQPISLDKAASISGIRLSKLQTLNPGYKKQVMPAEGPNRLLLPIEGTRALLNWNRSITGNGQNNALANADKAIDSHESHPNTTAFKPFRKVHYRQHTVQRGDNLWSIARQFNTDIEQLTNWNLIHSTSDPLQPGDKLWFASLIDDQERAPERKLMRYRVVSTDTVTQLAKKFNTRFSELKKWNRSLRGNHSLNPGQILLIPLP